MAASDELELHTHGSQTNENLRQRRRSPTTEQDIELFKAVASIQPSEAERGRKLDRWRLVADRVSAIDEGSEPFTAESCRNRQKYLLEKVSREHCLPRVFGEPFSEKLHQLIVAAIKKENERKGEYMAECARQAAELSTVVSPITVLASRAPETRNHASPEGAGSARPPPASQPINTAASVTLDDRDPRDSAQDATNNGQPETAPRATLHDPAPRGASANAASAVEGQDDRDTDGARSGGKKRPCPMTSSPSATKRPVAFSQNAFRAVQVLHRDIEVLKTRDSQRDASGERLSRELAATKDRLAVSEKLCKVLAEHAKFVNSHAKVDEDRIERLTHDTQALGSQILDLQDDLKAERAQRLALEEEVGKLQEHAGRYATEMSETRALQTMTTRKMEEMMQDIHGMVDRWKYLVHAPR